MPINYQPTTWNNEQDPPISADNLNYIEQGIKTTADRVDELVTVEANPSSSATDRLTGLEVDGTVYEVGGGHKVYTDDGTLLPQEPGLQFASGCVEDDAIGGKTVYIEMIRISQANYDTLKANGQLKPGAKYFIYDAQPVAVNASNLPYSSTQSTKQKIDEVESGWVETRWMCNSSETGTANQWSHISGGSIPSSAIPTGLTVDNLINLYAQSANTSGWSRIVVNVRALNTTDIAMSIYSNIALPANQVQIRALWHR